MGLVRCADCGMEVSSEAKACPKCGRPASRKRWLTPGRIVLLVVLAVFAIWAWSVIRDYERISDQARDHAGGR